jgi:hypothetical protein
MFLDLLNDRMVFRKFLGDIFNLFVSDRKFLSELEVNIKPLLPQSSGKNDFGRL